MNTSNDILPQPPPGIDLDVQARIAALFAQPESNNAPDKDPHKMATSHLEHTDAQPDESAATNGTSPTVLPTTPSSLEEPLLSPLAPPRRPKVASIIARFEYPCESRLQAQAQSQAAASDSIFPPTHAMPAPPLHPPSTPSLLTQTIHLIGDYITSYLTLSAQPAIIEYTPLEIIRRSNIRIEAQASTSAPLEGLGAVVEPEKVVRVMALVDGGGGADSTSGRGRVEEPRVVHITARPKRVKEILRGAGYRLTEDAYEADIHAALSRLRE